MKRQAQAGSNGSSRRRFSVLAMASFFVFGLMGSAQADFIVAPHPNELTSAVGSIFIFGSEGVSGTVTSKSGFNQAFTIDASGVVEITVSQANFLTQHNVVMNRALLVQSDDPISGYFLNRQPFTTDMTFLFDLEALGTDYYVMAWNQSVVGEGVQMSATAIEDNTVVTVTPSVTLTSGQPAGVPFNVTLDAGESIKFLSPSGSELTGSRMTSTKPIAVFAGAACANVPVGVPFCDHLYSQIQSINNYSSSYIVPETALTGSAGNLVRILAGTDNTEVTVNGSLVATLNAGQFHQINTANDLAIEASHPVLVAQYLKGTAATNLIGDPGFSIMTGLDQLLDAYAFTTPVGSGAFSQNFLNIGVPSASLGTLTLNGAPVDPGLFSAFGTTGYSVGNVPVAVGAGFIEADEPFVASLSGFSTADSYHSIIGATFTPGASPPPPPPPSVCDDLQSVIGTWETGAELCGNFDSTATSVTYESARLVPAAMVSTADLAQTEYTYEVDFIINRPNQPTAASGILVNGNSSSTFGNAQIWDQAIAFAITADGRYSIFRFNSNSVQALQPWTNTAAGLINEPGEVNTLAVSSTGTQLVFSINGEVVRTLNNPTPTGEFGMGFVRSMPTGGDEDDWMAIEDIRLEEGIPFGWFGARDLDQLVSPAQHRLNREAQQLGSRDEPWFATRPAAKAPGGR